MDLLNGIIVFLVCGLFPLVGISYAIYRLASLPMRKREQVRMFLILLDAGLKEGRTVEETIVSLAKTRDAGLGRRFQLLAICLSSGKLRLSEALETIPRFLPKQITAMLKAGEKLGDIRKVLPACRLLVKDSLSLTRNSVHYLLIAAFWTTPVAIVILAIIQTRVLPMFQMLAQDMGADSPPGLELLSANGTGFWLFGLLLLVLIWGTASLYIGMPPFHNWFQRLFPSLSDRLNSALPWRRKRLQRDFSSILALLLDNGVPEPEAVALAADCTANFLFIRRAQRVIAALNQGVKLTDAIQLMDDSGEFRWRLTNAMQAHSGFFKAIAGWNESLDAKAFQQQQSAAQIVASTLVVINGLFVGCIAVSVFSMLIALINSAALW